MISNHFQRKEFECHCGCGFNYPIDIELVSVLEDLREHFCQPVTVNSGLRCDDHNSKVGGKDSSKHLKGAADVTVKKTSPKAVFNYLEKKYPNKYGIGSYSTFTHVDTRPNKARW